MFRPFRGDWLNLFSLRPGWLLTASGEVFTEGLFGMSRHGARRDRPRRDLLEGRRESNTALGRATHQETTLGCPAPLSFLKFLLVSIVLFLRLS